MIMTMRYRGSRVAIVLVLFAVFVLSYSSFALASTEQQRVQETDQTVQYDVEGKAPHEADTAKLNDLLARCLNFGILAIVLIVLLRKPLKSFFSNRTQQIKSDFNDLESRKKEAEGKFEEIKKKLQQIEQEREKIIAQFVKEGQAEERKIIESAKEMSKRIEEQARITIDQEIKKAKEELQEEISEIAVNLAEELIKKNMKPEDEKRLISEYVNKVVEAA